MMKIEVDTKIQTADLVLKENQIKSDQYRAELSGYETAIRSASIKMEAFIDRFKVEATICGARIEADGLRFRSEANAIIRNLA